MQTEMHSSKIWSIVYGSQKFTSKLPSPQGLNNKDKHRHYVLWAWRKFPEYTSFWAILSPLILSIFLKYFTFDAIVSMFIEYQLIKFPIWYTSLELLFRKLEVCSISRYNSLQFFYYSLLVFSSQGTKLLTLSVFS